MTAIRKTIIDNIRSVCKVKKIKNVDIAEYMEVSPGCVSNWFNGTNFLDVDNLYKLCKFLGVSLDQIFGISPLVYNVLSQDENDIIVAYRKADPGTQSNIMKLLDLPFKKSELSAI